MKIYQLKEDNKTATQKIILINNASSRKFLAILCNTNKATLKFKLYNKITQSTDNSSVGSRVGNDIADSVSIPISKVKEAKSHWKNRFTRTRENDTMHEKSIERGAVALCCFFSRSHRIDRLNIQQLILKRKRIVERQKFLDGSIDART